MASLAMGPNGMAMKIARFDVVLVRLDPTDGRKIRKTRPCLVISPDEMNLSLSTLLVAPLTSSGRERPTRIATTFNRRQGLVVLDQIRTVDRLRVARRLGRIDPVTGKRVLATLLEMFTD